ncbi:Myosin type-2 heavy chain 1 [Coemansia sp. RSA 988]|nr:Myosin type-2 heavy chain 1 [Coemansia sp. RSA 988]
MQVDAAVPKTVGQALKILEHYTRGAKAWFEDADEAWVKGSLVQRTEDEALGVARLVFLRDDSVASTTAQLVAQTSPQQSASVGLHNEQDSRSRRMSIRAATSDELRRVVARGSRLTGGRISSKTLVDATFVYDILFSELVEPGADSELLPLLCNPPILDCTPDLTTLSYLHEPAVLYNLRRRYERRDIYTYSGVVLVAMNPFYPVSLYSPEHMARYAKAEHHAADPHLFAIAENAYRGMVQDQRNQTIIVYGESGSGKTTSAKYIMRYFAQAHHSDTNDEQMSTVESQILATNPVFESFGNAKTTRNDNSSRFGKFLEIKFERQRQQIVGGRIRTFLLERSRVVYQPPTERNYHIFYQLLAGADLQLREELHLDGPHASSSAFHYTCQGGQNSSAIAGVNDAEDFALTDASLEMVGINSTRRGHIWRTLAGILHLGNVGFSGTESTGSFVEPDCEPQFAIAAKLLGVSDAQLRQWLTRRQIVTRHDHILANVNRSQALVIRDSIAKFIYSRLFDWILGPINASLLPTEVDEQATLFVGVLDIYGFEHFEHNSFEQFCINYANEKLQQNFNHHVFKIEQEEYRREQLSNWTFIGFQDNQPCIDLIEGKPIGILALLDEESRLEQGSDRTFTEKLIRQFSEPQAPSSAGATIASYFRKPRFSNTAFTVRHYAHDVTYEGDGFLEKNKDTVPDEILDLLCSSEFEFVGTLASSHLPQDQRPSSPTVPVSSGRNSPAVRSSSPAFGSPRVARNGGFQRRQAPTLAGVFKRSLAGLMSTLGETEMHYIRCIKPNEAKQAWGFQAPMVLSQLRSCGVIETIRISKAGYPSRVPIRSFNERYSLLLGSNTLQQGSTPTAKSNGDSVTQEEHAVCRCILKRSLPDSSQYQVGLTKVFFRAGQWAIMEKKRSFLFESSAIVMQKFCRAILVLRSYRAMANAARRIQRGYRKHLFERKAKDAQRIIAARTIERYYIALCHRRKLTLKDRSACYVQTYVRRYLARRAVRRLAENRRDMNAARAYHDAQLKRQTTESRRTNEELARRGAEVERVKTAAQAARAKAMAAAAGQQLRNQHIKYNGHNHQRGKANDSPTHGQNGFSPSEGANTSDRGLRRNGPQAVSDAFARLSINTERSGGSPTGSQVDIRRTSMQSNEAARLRTAEARASLLAAGVAERNAETKLLRYPYSPLTQHSPASNQTAQHHLPQSMEVLNERDSVTIGDDLFEIINEFSVVADGRYGEVDARSLRKKDPLTSSNIPRYTGHSPAASIASPMPRQSSSGRRTPIIAPTSIPRSSSSSPMGRANTLLNSNSALRQRQFPVHNTTNVETANLRSQAMKRESHNSVATSAATSQTDYGGRHTAARARAWAARQKDRMMSAFSGERNYRHLYKPGISTDSDVALGRTPLFSDSPLEPPSALRFHHQSHSASNILAPSPARLTRLPSAGNLR